MLVILAVTILFIAVGVEAATVALHYTGMPAETARFQSISALTGTGFTTREAEDIVGHPVRRRIATALMLIGNLGLAILISSVVTSISTQPPWWQFALVLSIIGGILLLSRFRGLIRRFDRLIEVQVAEHLHRKPVAEVLQLGERYSVAEVTVPDNHRLAGQPLGKAELRQAGLMVLAIRRSGNVIHTPTASDRLRPADRVILYGERDAMDDLFDTEGAADP